MNLQVGDLVRYKKKYLDNRFSLYVSECSKLGIILDENPKYYFVNWIGYNQPYVCEPKNALELAK